MEYYRAQIDWDYIEKFDKDDYFWLFGRWHKQIYYTSMRTRALRIKKPDLDKFKYRLSVTNGIREEFIWITPVNYVGKDAKIWEPW